MDDLDKYEALLSGIPEIDDAIRELIAMVREARQELLDASYAGGNEILEQFERANAAERELAELKRRQAKALEDAEKALDELVIDQEISVKSEYGWPDIHPAMQKKFERDMASVNDAKIVLASIRELKEE